MCNFFVFASMIEYAFAQLLIRMKEFIANPLIMGHYAYSHLSIKYFCTDFSNGLCVMK